MHGRVHQDSKNRRNLGRSCSQHMPPVLPLVTSDNTEILAGDNSAPRDSAATTSCGAESFIKDGRQISVGDSALFKPPKDSPPFVGLIRWLALDKENNLQLGVNWQYRSSELRLGKGTLLDSAPNEIFYSFQKDEVPAASLLHPCKVAFLARGVELPPGTCSFICRRAYDIANKSLWWLTDRQFINDQQEEIDKLLYKTRIEMHPTLQPGARSPQQNNGQNGVNAPTQAKGKKRERGDYGSDSIKRGNFPRLDDGESNLRHEIAKITEKAGVVDLDGVEKLVQLMQLDTPERKLDLGSRSMLAYVLASTDKIDCLSRFVHLRGLPVLDSWLQDIHKGKIGDGNNTIKDGDKPVEEFLQVLLRALENIPVNLQALQTCNIGRSVNHLRSHKNMEIQRKARTLVDTWKKRVEAEMISIDVKSRLPEASHAGSRTPGAMKSSLTQNSSAKTSSSRSSPGKESQVRSSGVVNADATQIREDRSSSSNQSQNNGQSLSVKDDVKSFTSHSAIVNNKTSSTSTRNRKNSGFVGTPVKSTALEKSSHSSITGDKVVEGPISDGIGHKLIVKIPNRLKSPARGVCGESTDDTIIMSSQASSSSSSPVQKHKKTDPSPNDKGKAFQCKFESDVNNDQTDHTADASDKLNSVKLQASSFSPMKALVESCAKYSEATSSLSLDDDVGMNLLASVAAGEISRSDVVSPNDSTEWTTPAVEEVCSGVVTKSKPSPNDHSAGVHNQDEFSSERICHSSGKIPAVSMDGTIGTVTEDKDGTNLDSGEFKLMAGDTAYQSLEESNSEFRNEVLGTSSISPPKPTSTVIEAELVEASNKDLGQSECGQQSLPEPGGSVKVEPIMKGDEDCMSKLDPDKGIQSQSLSCSTSQDLNCKMANLENQEIVKQESQKDELREKNSASIRSGNTGKSTSACTGSVSSAHSGGTDPYEKMKFDLNEDFSNDDVKYEEPVTLPSTMVDSLPFPVSSILAVHSATSTLASAANCTFFPPDDLLRSKPELGWKGSAATSAFCPAEPRKNVEMAVGTSNSCRQDRFPLDIDLNVPDERLLEEMASQGSMQPSSGVLDLDLNRSDEANDNARCSNHGETSLAHVKPETNMHIQRDFDLNDGSTVDEASVRQFPVSQLVKKDGLAAQLPSAGFSNSNQGPSSFAPWFSPGNTYSTVAIPSILPQRLFGQFNPDMYRGSVLSSSPAMPFPSGPFQYPVFAFGTTFPLPSGTFSVGGASYQDSSSSARIFPSPMNLQYMGSVGNNVAPQFQRPFMVNVADVSNNGVMDNNRKWARLGLDLNAGPGTVESEAKEEILPRPSGQQSVSSFQALAEEQARTFSVSGGILKRREDSEPTRHRHSAWQ